MKRKIQILSLIIMTISTIFTVTSCCGKNKYGVIFDYYLTCSEDLLSFASPVVSYINSNGENQTITLSRADFKEEDVNEQKMLVWHFPSIRYESWEVQSEATVRYELKPNVEISSERTYIMQHNLHCKVTHDDKYNQSGIKTTDHSSEDVSLSINIQNISGILLQVYLEDLKSRIEELTITIDNNGAMKPDFHL